MSRVEKILKEVLSGTSDANIAFTAVRQLLKRLEFQERIRGGHHIFTRDNVEEIINIQPKGGKAKPYQAKQVRGIILKYRMEV